MGSSDINNENVQDSPRLDVENLNFQEDSKFHSDKNTVSEDVHLSGSELYDAKDSSEEDKRVQKEYREMLATYGTGALNFGGCLVVGFCIGHWLDGKFETNPVLTVIWTLLGLAAGVIEVVKLIQKAKSLS